MAGTPHETIEAWHFTRAGGRLGYDKSEVCVTPGLTLTVEPPIALCARGLHASIRAIDALEYAPSASGLMICRVRCGGTIIDGDDKLVATERTVLWMAEADRTLHEMACWSAEAALFGQAMRGRTIDPRSLAAIDAKRRWLDGQASDSELAAARDAAWDAARAAARAAAWDAARDAARDAAWDAARDTFRPAVSQCQSDALALIDAMIAEGAR